MTLNKQRKRFIELTKQQLIGSDLKDNLLIGQKPLDRFFTGFLFPIVEGEELEGGIETNGYNTLDNKEEAVSVKKVKRYIPPSSAGFSFFITGKNIQLRVFYNAVQYSLIGDRDEQGKFIGQIWKKHYLADDGKEVVFTLDGARQYKIFDDKAKIDTLWRPYNDGYIVTVTMSNDTKIDATKSRKIFGPASQIS